jgi:hypothetical protein
MKTLQTIKTVIMCCALLIAGPHISVYAEDLSPVQLVGIDMEVKGLTSAQRLLRQIGVTSEVYEFDSYDDLEKFIVSLQQKMTNKRIFDEISYELIPELSDDLSVKRYRVWFYVDDAFTTLVIPYAKYDSNYGAKAGVKLFDHNVLGTLSELALTSTIRQEDLSWDEPVYFTSLTWNRIPFFGTTLDTAAELNIRQTVDGFTDGDLRTSFNFSDLSLLNHRFNISAQIHTFQLDQEYWGDSEIDISFSIHDIMITETHNLALSTTVSIDQNDHWFDDFAYTLFTGASVSGIDMLVTDITLNTGLNFAVDTYRISSELTSIYFGASDSYALPFGVSYATGIKYVIDLANSQQYITFDNSLSYGRIDWKHNYREGLSLSLSNSLTYRSHYLYEPPAVFPSYTAFHAKAFAILFDSMNIGSRFTGFYSAVDSVAFMNSTAEIPAQYMRGILDEDFPSYTGRYGGILNLNVMGTLIDLDGIAELIVSPFLDVGIFEGEEPGAGLRTEYSGGIEFYGIFDSYQSYPFNASIGLDLSDVSAWFARTLGDGTIGYEIMMSLNLFY